MGNFCEKNEVPHLQIRVLSMAVLIIPGTRAKPLLVPAKTQMRRKTGPAKSGGFGAQHKRPQLA
jgi:hypothetical protein